METKQIHVKMDSNLHQALKIEAAASSKTIQETVIELIKEFVSKGEIANYVKEKNEIELKNE